MGGGGGGPNLAVYLSPCNSATALISLYLGDHSFDSSHSEFSSSLELREPMKWTLAHRNRSDFCDLRLRCPSQTPEIARFPKQEKAMPHCDLRVRSKVASDLRFRAAISEPKTPSFCGISGDLAQSTRKSLAIAIVRFWCAKLVAKVETAPWLGRQPNNFCTKMVQTLDVVGSASIMDSCRSVLLQQNHQKQISLQLSRLSFFRRALDYSSNLCPPKI